MSANLIDLNNRRLRGETPLDVISKPHFGVVPDDGRVFSRRNSRFPLNRRFSNGRFSQNINSAIPPHTPVEILQRENFENLNNGKNYRYNNPFAVGNSRTYQNPNFKARYDNADFQFPLDNPGPSPGDGFNMREAVYGRPYGNFNPPGAGINRIAGRSITKDVDVETYETLSPANKGYNPFGFPQKKRGRSEGYRHEGMMQSPYLIPVNELNLPTSIHSNESFSKLKQNTNVFGVPNVTSSNQSRLWDEVAMQERSLDNLQPEMFPFTPQTNKNDKMVLVNLLILTFVLLVLTLMK